MEYNFRRLLENEPRQVIEFTLTENEHKRLQSSYLKDSVQDLNRKYNFEGLSDDFLNFEKLGSRINERLERIIFECVKEKTGIILDMEKERNSRFPRFSTSVADYQGRMAQLTVYFDNGSEKAKRIVTFQIKHDTIVHHDRGNVEINSQIEYW
ncbi:hypothetical protein LAG90_15745 [Marinilongibacter aquaticus]|uniref:hypothetical protein n=1 Tax=Marinilongibacter aquaticus TaxID=2975157 RepID=UPI0021BDCB0B|nr:hypothetical protein [Marinilongibacter aquaticus]UBM58257.1 hypothetical protein LAG90_15745 [Marinilongibacter aquaticus]